MKVKYESGQEIEVDALEVGNYYKHVSSDTLWRIHSTTATPIGVTVDLELVNTYGDVRDVQFTTMMMPIMSNKGTFVEIEKSEFEARKGR